ncbi:hypothetical protein Droror1_Dr00028238, partial [Drosera rotundifolia]
MSYAFGRLGLRGEFVRRWVLVAELGACSTVVSGGEFWGFGLRCGSGSVLGS